MRRADREDGRRLVQPHDLRGLRRRVLLALHARDLRPPLPLALRLHLLGKEAVVSQEEADVAAGYAGGGAGGDRAAGGHLHPGHDHRDPGVGREEAPFPLQQGQQAQAEHHHHPRSHVFSQFRNSFKSQNLS